ncbi:MAG: sugar isomerase [Angelakisella sp.]
MDDLINCIDRIPEKLKEIHTNRDTTFGGLMDYLSSRQSPEELVFIASGSSYNGAFAVEQFAREQCGLKVSLVYPNIFVNYTHNLNNRALYIFISQTGFTKLVHEGIEKVQAGGCMNCAIAADSETPIAKKADVFIDMGCGHEEFMYRTVGYSATVATLYLMSIKIALQMGNISQSKAEEFYADFTKLPEGIAQTAAATEGWYKKNKFSLLRRNKMLLTATNDYWPVVQEADIKIMEMVPIMTRSFELEEFIHGPQNAFNDEMLFFILSKAGEDEQKVTAIANFLKSEIGFCSVVGACARDDKDLKLVPMSKYFSPLEMVTAFQLLAYHMATDKGRDLKRGVNTSITNYITKTISK